MSGWRRHRFTATNDERDPRPVGFPSPGPHWCTGLDSDDRPIVVAWLPADCEVTDPNLWPDAVDVDSEERGPPSWTDRFPKPDWYDGPSALQKEGDDAR